MSFSKFVQYFARLQRCKLSAHYEYSNDFEQTLQAMRCKTSLRTTAKNNSNNANNKTNDNLTAKCKWMHTDFFSRSPSCEGKQGWGLINVELPHSEIEQVGERSNHSHTLHLSESASISRGGNVSAMRPGHYCQRKITFQRGWIPTRGRISWLYSAIWRWRTESCGSGCPRLQQPCWRLRSSDTRLLRECSYPNLEKRLSILNGTH